MLNVDPVFVSKPESWPVTQRLDLPINLSPTATREKRWVKTGCSYKKMDVYLEMPCFWSPERVDQEVSRFRHVMERR